MVNIHAFDLSGTELKTKRAKECLMRTLSFQSNIILYVWSMSDPEIEEIIKNSPYCQKALECCNKEQIIFQYVKMIILSRYGGFCIELDQIIKTDLSKLPLDFEKSYIPIFDSENSLLVAWHLLYVKKGLDVSEVIKLADTTGTENFTGIETDICKIKTTKEMKDVSEFFGKVSLSHYQSPIFTDKAQPEKIKFDIVNNKVEVSLFNCYRQHINHIHYLEDFDVFIECCNQYQTFEKVLPSIAKSREVVLTKRFYEKIKNIFYIDDRIKLEW